MEGASAAIVRAEQGEVIQYGKRRSAYLVAIHQNTATTRPPRYAVPEDAPYWSRRQFSESVVCAVTGVPGSELDDMLRAALVPPRARGSRSRYSFLDAVKVKVARRLRQVGVPLDATTEPLRRVSEMAPTQLLEVTLLGEYGGTVLLVHSPSGEKWIPPEGSHHLFGVSLSRVATEVQTHLGEFAATSDVAEPDLPGESSAVRGWEDRLTRLSGILGEAVSEADAREDLEWHVEQAQTALQAVLGTSVSLVDASEATGLSITDLLEAYSDRRIAAVEHEDGLWIPSWQFGVSEPFVNGLLELVRRYPGDSVSLSEWVLRPHPDLEFKPPLTLLQAGRSEEVLVLVDALLSASW